MLGFVSGFGERQFGAHLIDDFSDAVGIADAPSGRVSSPSCNVHFVNIDDLTGGSSPIPYVYGRFNGRETPGIPLVTRGCRHNVTRLPFSLANRPADGTSTEMFSKFDPVELTSTTNPSKMVVTSVPSTEFQIPVLPSGSELTINIMSNWYSGV